MANIIGTDFDDQLVGTEGDDSISGGKGNDTLIGGAGSDLLDGGIGLDRVDYSGSPAGVQLDLSTGFALDGTVPETLLGIEQAIGSDWDDALTGDAGANLLQAGFGNDRLDGGKGNDALHGGKGDDVLTGGLGADVLAPEGGFDVVSGGGDADTLVLSGLRSQYQVSSPIPGQQQVFVNLFNPESVSVTEVEFVQFADGTFTMAELTGGPTEGDDFLVGDDNTNVIDGLGGNDTIEGRDGGDVLFGGKGSDVLDGGSGDDILVPGSGNDTIVGGKGTDMLSVEGYRSQFTITASAPGVQQLVDQFSGQVLNLREVERVLFFDGNFSMDELLSGGTDGDDHLVGDDADNVIDGRAGNDTIEGLGGFDQLFGGSGDDLLDGGTGADLLYGDFGADTYVLDRPDDQVLEFGADFGETDVVQLAFVSAGVYIVPQGIERVEITAPGALAIDVIGSTSNLMLVGGAGPNALTGGKGNDTLDGGLGNDVLSGGEGFDSADYRASSGAVSVNLATGLASGARGSDSLVGIEALLGSAFNDTLLGDGLYNRFIGGAGADLIDGGAGGSWIEPGPGNDTVRGGSGEDWLSYLGLSSGVVVDLKKGTATSVDGVDQVSGIDVVNATAFSDRLTGDRNDNVFVPNGGDDVIDGGAGNDTLWVYSDAAKVIDLARGLAFGGGSTVSVQNVETIHATGFNDTMLGGRNADVLFGGKGQDELRGARGNDTLKGELGNDLLWGDDGDDVLDGGFDADVLTGGAGRDRFELTGADIALGLDTIADFQPGIDTLVLSAAVLAALSGLAGSRVDPDTNLFLDYDPATGVLSYDDDGPAAGFGAQPIALLGLVSHPASLGPDILIAPLG